jgi:hypothetical protein
MSTAQTEGRGEPLERTSWGKKRRARRGVRVVDVAAVVRARRRGSEERILVR